MDPGIGIPTYAGNLACDLRTRRSAADDEAGVPNFPSDMRAWTGRADRCQLIPDLGIHRLELFGERERGAPCVIK